MMFNPLESIMEFIGIMNSGEVIMWVIFALNLMLWYGLGYRYVVLHRGSRGNVRKLLNKYITRGKIKEKHGILDDAIVDAVESIEGSSGTLEDKRNYIYDALFPYYIDIRRYAVMIQTIALLAPLVGLLGTVTGMIETFTALQSSDMYSQSNSISGGISKALFATELGLMVAVAGLILGKILDRKAEEYEEQFEQITKILCTKDSHEI
jgi:biopolymer transport protein ExbB